MTSIDIGSLDDFVVDRASRHVVQGIAIAVVRIGDEVYAIGDRCSHANVSLSEGRVDCAAKGLECWRHGAEFSLETGKPSGPPAVRGVPVYVASVEDGRVLLHLR
ncbi:MAG: Rieske 2Fe-2S domain-containing protein [Acidimicrobiales bacterium]